MIRRSWTRVASVEETLALWAASLREIKQRIRPLFTQERVATNAGLFLEGLLGDEQRKTGWMRAEAAGDPGPWRQQAILGRRDWDADALRDIVRDYTPEADWRVGDPLHLLSEVKNELDVVASILPMNAKSTTPLKVTPPGGDAVELRDDLGNLLLVAASVRLSSSGVGLFVVTPSFFFSPGSVFRQFGDLGLGVEAALALRRP